MSKNTGLKINTTAVAIGVASVAAAAVGAYWLYGAKHALKHRQMAASWILKARAEVMEAVGKLRDIDKVTYFQIVDEVIRRYAKSHNSTADVARVTKETKAAWSHIHRAIKPAKKVAKKIVRKVT